VSQVTGKNFIIDPRVRAQVTMLSSTPMSPDAFYEAFLAILQVHGFVAVPAGNVIKIIPDANARQLPANDLPAASARPRTKSSRRSSRCKNVSAAQLVPILRPLIPQYGHLAAYPSSNILIISDRANNVNRMLRIIAASTRPATQDIEVVQLQNASAGGDRAHRFSADPGAGQAEGGAPRCNVVADDRTNSVLISGDAGPAACASPR
jgi:general secretion pathway protein D